MCNLLLMLNSFKNCIKYTYLKEFRLKHVLNFVNQKTFMFTHNIT